ncbi:ribulose-phosphate 3-epimerase [Lachnospiraceae bacterium OttesenSCG-928-D06]|nr:ribulose-phosphate 3-epimerase [Lachnospiraceae bacterium OttesenSCG-928-D06]
MNILSPSILAADFWKLGEEITAVEKAGAQYLHFDVMDGLFVPSISFGMPVLASIKSKSKLFLDVHLMIDKPERYIDTFAECGADLLTFHIEATTQIEENIQAIKEKGMKVGLTIKPTTEVSLLLPYLHEIDMVLIMTVEPGFGGQKILPSCIEKVREVRDIIKERNLHVDVEVDGGINMENVRELVDAGANIIVAGSAVFQGNIEENVREMLRRMEE